MASLELEKYHKLSSAFCSKGSLNLVIDRPYLDEIVTSNLSKFDELWRGVSIKELLFNNFEVGSTICLNRLTSFTESLQVAKDFSADEYGTHTLFRIKDSYAFNYSKYSEDLMMKLIDDNHITNDIEIEYMLDQISMVREEKEWMVESNRKYKIESISFRNSKSVEHDYTIIELVPEQAQISDVTKLEGTQTPL